MQTHELIELQFQDILCEDILSAYKAIVAYAHGLNTLDILGVESARPIGGHDFEALQSAMNQYLEASYFANTKRVDLPNVSIAFCSIFIFKEGKSYSLMLIFNECDIHLNSASQNTLQALKITAIDLKDKLHASSALCGLEPATDKDTQFFAV